ncbi:hypothetical protein [Gallaecimonas sp. GXIMD4217]|uniref:hypothetical protein n=1 Tax=Gallaecimonas sp. GXIMD4217 TaxID=3131927 RepID=UPI00311B0F98
MMDFDRLNKLTARSFNDQKAIIKKVMQGKKVLCRKCGQPLRLVLPGGETRPGIRCARGCTDIELDFA